jgi:hypothetical protein
MAISQRETNIISSARLHPLTNVPAHRPMCSIHPDCHGWGAHHPFSCRGTRKWLRHYRLRLCPWQQLLQPSNCLRPSSIRLKMGCAIVMAILWVVWSSGLLFDGTNEYYLTFVPMEFTAGSSSSGVGGARPLSSQGRQARELVDLSLWNPETSRILADLSLWMEAAITSFAATNAADCSLMALTADASLSRRLGVRFFRTGFSSSGIGWSLALESEMGRLWQVCCEWCHVKWIFWSGLTPFFTWQSTGGGSELFRTSCHMRKTRRQGK